MYAPRLGSQMHPKPGPNFSIHEESHENSDNFINLSSSTAPVDKRATVANENNRALPLTTSVKANQQPQVSTQSFPNFKVCEDVSKVKSSAFKPLHEPEGTPRQDIGSAPISNTAYEDSSTLSGKTKANPLKSDTSQAVLEVHESSSLVKQPDREEVDRLKQELAAAQNQIARMDEELFQSRIVTYSLHATSSPLSDEHDRVSKTPSCSSHGVTTETSAAMRAENQSSQVTICPPVRRIVSPDVASSLQENSSCRRARELPGPNSSSRGGWDNYQKFPIVMFDSASALPAANMTKRSNMASFHADVQHFPNLHGFTVSFAPGDTDLNQSTCQAARPASTLNIAPNDCSSYSTSTASTPCISPPITPLPLAPHGHTYPPVPYQPRPIGTPLSPTALEFSAAAMSSQSSIHGGFWNEHYSSDDMAMNAGHLTHVEPINYRRLLDKNMSCNWRYIVDKIVYNNDQQASIFLQQKLKVATPEQKFELIEAIIAQAYPLMVNRFGNFLVQRCFEHGTPEQVIAIANAIRGNTLTLSMDAFGCHVVQKAFDAVPEEYKAIMVHELLRRIPETVIHRYACHVWQKLFELRWSDSPPQIMKYVNEALRGMWHEVALGETGSLVVQNIFENCLEEDKRPCVNEILASIDIVSHGQFGNWCIQHISEHGSVADKSCAIEHVLRFATEYSTDQFASKVVEKCLKVGGSDFLDRYLERVCERRPDRPRMPLIDIAGDQYGNYLIQYILINAEMQHREMVAQQVRKHMVSLRGSKFGSRVAMLCSNPAFCTRPGPPTNMVGTHRYFNSNSSASHGNFARADSSGHYR